MLNDRRQLLQEMKARPAADLLSQLEPALRRTDTSKPFEEKSALIAALPGALRNDSSQSALQQLAAWLGDTSLSYAARAEVASILGAVQTPQSVQSLLASYQQATDERTREFITEQIAKTGDDRWAARFHEELSPEFETAWAIAKADPTLAGALAVALAKIGSESGVKLLLAEVVSSASSVEALADLNNPSARAALSALPKVRNPSRWRSDKLTRLCSAKLTHPVTA